ncbi:hypothetical protein ES703_121738 [subsurface metagenome]
MRFKGCEQERQFWLAHLREISDNDSTHERFRSCGDVCWVEHDVDNDRYYLAAETCKLRICPACRKRIQHRTSSRVLEYYDAHPNLKWQFITLTLKHTDANLSSQLDRLTASFRKLRQRSLWKSAVPGGYAVIEVTFHAAGTFNPSGRMRESAEWHPHLHVLVQTEWINWSDLRKAWLSVTGDSNNIDCQHVNSARSAAHYVAKYIGKPPNLDFSAHLPEAKEWYDALLHRRLLIPFGPQAERERQPPPPQPRTERICRFKDLLAAAHQGNYPAQSILTRLIFHIHPPGKKQSQQQKLPYANAPP